MKKYADAGRTLLQSDDTPFVNQYGGTITPPTPKTAPLGGFDGEVPPGGGGIPVLTLSTVAVAFYAKTGGANPPQQTVAITNTGTGTLAYTVGLTPSWLSITPPTGSAPATLQLTALSAGLSASTYSVQVTITALGALDSPAYITVTLIVEDAAQVPLVEPINKKAWLGYFKTSTFNGEYTSIACPGTVDACVVQHGDFGGDPASVNWLQRQRTAATQISALGGKIFIGAREDEILNMKSQWDQVGGFFTALEGFSGTISEQVAALEANISATKAILVREGLPQRIFMTYIDSAYISQLPRWPSGMNWLMLGAYLSYVGAETAESVRARGTTLISTSLASIRPRIPTGGKIVLAAQAYDRFNWDATTLEYLQKVYPDALRTYPELHGIFWFCYERYTSADGKDHGTRGYPNLTPWHRATRQAILGRPEVEVPSSSGPMGTLSVCDTSTISGIAYDPSYPSQSVIVQIFDGPGVLGQNDNRVAQLSTNPSTSAFSMATPAPLLDGASHSVYVYVLSKTSPQYQVQLSGSPKTVILPGGFEGVLTNGRSFYYNGTLFPWKGATAFMAVKLMLEDGSSAMNSRLDYWQSKGVNNLRVFGMISTAGYWAPWAFNPRTAGYYTAWRDLLIAAAARNIVIEACFFADAQLISPYDTSTGRLDGIKEFITQLASHKNFTIEVCNEPYKNGISSAQELVTLATAVQTIDPSRIVTFGASTPASDTSYSITPASYYAIHSDRTIGWTWVVDVFSPSNPNVSQNGKPCVDNEPINATSNESSQKDPDPARWYAYGLGCQLRQLSSTFHYGDGKFAALPDGTTQALLDQWLTGRGDVSWSWGGIYFHGSYPTSGLSPFNNTGSERLVMGRIRSSSGVALVVASPSWTPSLRPGWTATQVRKVTDNTNSYSAYYLTLSYA